MSHIINLQSRKTLFTENISAPAASFNLTAFWVEFISSQSKIGRLLSQLSSALFVAFLALWHCNIPSSVLTDSSLESRNSKQLTGGYFHDNGPSSPPLLCSLLKSVLQARPPKTFSDVDFVLMKLSKTLNFFLEKEVKTSNSLEKAF